MYHRFKFMKGLLSGYYFFKLFSKTLPSELIQLGSSSFGKKNRSNVFWWISSPGFNFQLHGNIWDILLIDEPISHLSLEWAIFFIDWMQRLKKNKLLITVSDQTDLLSDVSDQIYEIKNQYLKQKLNALEEGHREFIWSYSKGLLPLHNWFGVYVLASWFTYWLSVDSPEFRIIFRCDWSNT